MGLLDDPLADCLFELQTDPDADEERVYVRLRFLFAVLDLHDTLWRLGEIDASIAMVCPFVL